MTTNTTNNNGWAEWSKHVLKELERLNHNHEMMREKIDDVKNIVQGSNIEEIKTWKKEMENIASPPQLKELIDKVNDNEKFKVKVITAITLAHVAIGIVIAILAI